MEVEWDEEKRQQIIAERDLDILQAVRIFEGFTLTKEDRRQDYGEKRFISLGVVNDVPYIVVHTPRGNRLRIITAWKGGRNDYEKYKNSLP
jgi:uncharacterized DUF497 family protein